MEAKPVYDEIGKGYDHTRKADPYLAERILHFLQPNTEGHYLDVGCGTGNYTSLISNRGYHFTGIDPSSEMLTQAQERSDSVLWRQGSAESTGMKDDQFDGIITTMTLHHWTNLTKGFEEMNRVLKPGGRVVMLTSLPKQTSQYWLAHYFPECIRKAASTLPSLQQIESALGENELRITQTESYNVLPDLKDLFLYSGKHHPECYFDPKFRQGISAFRLLATLEEIESGLVKLRHDLDHGVFDQIKASYDHGQGDYQFVVLQC